MKTQFKKIPSLSAILALGFFVACSSGKKSDDSGEPPPSDEAILEAVETVPEGSQDTGLLTFFNGAEKGLVVKSIRWNKPLSSENPGADCELKQKGDSNFVCVVRQGAEAVVLTIAEAGAGAKAHLAKISLDGKTEATKARWVNELKGSGFTAGPVTPSKKIVKQSFLSKDKKTKVEMIWVPAVKAVTLIFKP